MGEAEITIRTFRKADWQALCAIYLQGIEERNATFETQLPNWRAWDRSHLDCCRLVAELDGRVCGWAALSPVSRREAYAGVAAVSVYVGRRLRRRGVGRRLLETLIAASEDAGFWTLESSLFPENQASIRLHQICGFRLVGRRLRIGFLEDRWRDTLLMERRSERIGSADPQP